MQDLIKTLLRRIRRWHRGSFHPDIPVALGRTALPPPQISWALLALMHYLQRKLWAWRTLIATVAPEAAGCEGAGIGELNALERQESGIVPGARPWTYTLAGNGSCLTNQATGECIHLDVYNGPEFIETGCFFAYVRDQRFPGVAEQRLRELLPSGGLIAGTRWLGDCGALHVIEATGGDPLSLELHGSLLKYSEAIEAFLVAWGKPEDRIDLAALLWDWPALRVVADSLGEARLAAHAGVLARQVRRRWRMLLNIDIENGLCEATPHPLADVGIDDVLAGPEATLADIYRAMAVTQITGRGSLYHGHQDKKDGMK